MKVQCFSSFTFSYLNRARVLFSSLKKFHPDWELVALIIDDAPSGFTFRPDQEPFDTVIYARDLGIEQFESWIFQHDVVEACTAVKGPFMHRACSSGADAIVYLDPDTCLFGSLEPLAELLGTWDIILTPHTTEPESERAAIMDNEISPLRTGIYNLGFCAIRTSGEGARFAAWWRERLLSFCYDDIPNGLFVDQRWCDHVPGLFDRVKILRDPGYNVASWNLSNRHVDIRHDGSITVNGSPLRFWHFTKLGPIADVMTRRYAGKNFPVYEIWNWYRRQIDGFTDSAIPARYWFYDTYDNGVPIEKRHRVLYRSNLELQMTFPSPFTTGPNSFYAWLLEEGLADEIAARRAG